MPTSVPTTFDSNKKPYLNERVKKFPIEPVFSLFVSIFSLKLCLPL